MFLTNLYASPLTDKELRPMSVLVLALLDISSTLFDRVKSFPLTVFISCLYLMPFPFIFPLNEVSVGYSIAYHLKTNYVEFSNAILSKREASDLVKVGKLYSCIIIPIFNLIVFSIIFGVIS